MKIGIAADHGGFELKQNLHKYLLELGYDVTDFGAYELDSKDDYPDLVIPLARAVAEKEVERGIAVCGSGVGAAVVANKMSGVRAALINDHFSAHQGVEDDDLNLLCLGGRITGFMAAQEYVAAFLKATFTGAERHKRRLQKVIDLEQEQKPKHNNMETTIAKVLFLDVGGVLLTNGWGHESRMKAATEFRIDYEEFSRLHEFIFNVYEIGSINLEEYLDTVIFNRPRDFTKEDFKSYMYAQSIELPDMLQWLIEWKSSGCGFRIISINNEGKELNDYRIKKFKLHRCFDAFVSSCEVGIRKPDPRIFKLAMGIAIASPEQCYYFDDRPMLVEAAARLGIHAYHHENFETTKGLIESF